MMQEHCIYAKCFDILDEAQGKIFTGKTESRRQRNLDGRTVVDAMMEYTCKEMTPGISSPHKLAQNRKPTWNHVWENGSVTRFALLRPQPFPSSLGL